jgi:hypothetical protein
VTHHLILAGNASEADEWRRDVGLTRREARYIGSVNALRGYTLSRVTVVRVGTYSGRRDVADIEDMLRMMRAWEL